MLEANFWQDKENSKKVIKEKKLFEDLIKYLQGFNRKTFRSRWFKWFSHRGKKRALYKKKYYQNIKELRTLVKKNEVKCFLSNEADSLDCYIEIHAGSGGHRKSRLGRNAKKNVSWNG